MPSLIEIKNCVEASPRIYSSGQPTKIQLHGLHLVRVKAVINLGLSDAEYSIDDEAEIVKRQRVDYFHIPVNFAMPGEKELQLFFKIMDKHSGNKVLVHCAANKRAICFVGLWGERSLGWSHLKSDELINKVWKPNDVWSGFLTSMRKMSACCR